MTPKERAEKIWDEAESSGDPIDFIQAEIEEAEREAIERIMVDERREQARLINERDNAYFKGFAAARETAKGIAKVHPCAIGTGSEVCNCDLEIAERIASMTPDVAKMEHRHAI